ncbi:MAG: hypothetical protein Kow00121_00170 [Elainellaceae cyanobacterium]
MQDKHKVTLYLPPELHRQLKIRSAVDLEPMSALAERAIVFYLENSEIVEEVEALHGHTHRIYNCPQCASSLVMRQGEMVPVSEQSAVLLDEDAAPAVGASEQRSDSDQNQKDEGELVPLLG